MANGFIHLTQQKRSGKFLVLVVCLFLLLAVQKNNKNCPKIVKPMSGRKFYRTILLADRIAQFYCQN